MIGNTLPISATLTTKLVREGNYASEYRLRDSASDIAVNIKHSIESKLVNGERMDRHYVSIKRTFYPGTDNGVAYPAREYEAYVVMRTPHNDDTGRVGAVLDNLVYALNTANTDGIRQEVLGWES